MISIILSTNCFSQNDNLKFSRYSIEDGLSQNSVNSMIQDDRGFVWVGTQDGLNRYDGYQFKHYRNDHSNLNSLSNNFIEVVLQGKNGNIWIGTRNGLNKYNPSANSFTRFHHNIKDTTTISNNRIRCIGEDRNGVLWVGTIGGLNRYDASTKSFVRFFNDTLNDESVSSNYIKAIYFDNDNTMWVGTDAGLNRYNEKSNTFTEFQNIESDSESISSKEINYIFQDKNDVLWIGTSSGLNKFDYEKEEFSSYQHDAENESSLSNNRVQSIIEDKNGVLWICTVNGLNKFNRTNERFTRYKNSLNNPKSISGNYLNCIFQDFSGMIWIGTQERGCNMFNPDQKKFNHFKTPIEVLGKPSGNYVWTIQEDKNGNLWYGTNNGIYIYNPISGQFRLYQKNENDKESGVLGKTVYSLRFDKNENLWIGTGGGLSRLNNNYIRNIWNEDYPTKFIHYSYKTDEPDSYSGGAVSTIYEDEDVLWVGTFNNGLHKVENISSDDANNTIFTAYKPELEDSNSISHTWINSIVRDGKNNLWIGTDLGLDRMDETNGTFKHYALNLTQGSTESTISVSCIYPEEEDVLWLGSYGGGINKYNIEEEINTHYTMKDGLPNNYIYGILKDNNDNLWLSTNNGVSKFNPINETFRNYNVNDGLQSNEFNTGAYYKSESGKLYFGGINGINFFNADSIKNNEFPPSIFFTQLNVLNKPVKIGLSNRELGISYDEEILLTKNLSETDTIQLSYEHNIFSIQYAGLHFQTPDQNHYAYQLKGFDNDWVYTSADNRRATYSNLSPGTYTFKVKASNSDGVWNEEGRSIVIIVTPPFWQTWWFYILCVIVAVAILYVIFRGRLKQVKIRSEKEYFKKQNEEKVHMMKEIHHRVKNNLQIVNSLLRLQSFEVKDEKILAMFKESQDRILSMAKLHEQLYQSEDFVFIDIKTHFETLVKSLINEYQVGVNIKLDIKVEEVDIGVKTLVPLGLMINEMITNSLKYAFKDRTDGIITVHLNKTNDKKHEIIIGDNGVGLKEEEKAKGLGSELIQIFTDQIRGTIKRLDQPGTVYKIVFENIDTA